MKRLVIRPPRATIDELTNEPTIQPAEISILDRDTGQSVDLIDELVGLELQLAADGCYVTVDLGPFEPDIEFDAIVTKAVGGPPVQGWLEKVTEAELDQVLANGGVRDKFSTLILKHLREKARTAAQ